MTYDNEEILEIDENLLDEAWIKQPKLYYRFARDLVEARTKVEEIKNELEIQKTEVENVKATLDMSIRNNPETFGIAKITETAVKNVVSTQPEYKDAVEEYNKIQKQLISVRNDADVLSALVTALDHKKSALENLVRLHGQSYFSTPQAPREEGAREYINESLKRKARMKTKVGKE